MTERFRTDCQNSETFLTRRELAARWKVGVETVKRRVRAGLVPDVRFNSRCVRYRLSDIIDAESRALVTHGGK